MHRRDACAGLILVALFAARPARAAPPATPDEAKALAEKAAAYMQKVGPEKAIADFNDPKGAFIDRELFVVVYSPDHKIVTSAGLPILLGKDATTLKDVEGHAFGQEIIALAKAQGRGWVDYRMTNPMTKKVGLKTSWVIQVGDYVVFVGAFKS